MEFKLQIQLLQFSDSLYTERIVGVYLPPWQNNYGWWEKKKSSVQTNDHLNFLEENVISLFSGNF